MDDWNWEHNSESGFAGGKENRFSGLMRNFRKSTYRGDVGNAIRFYHRLVEEGYTYEQFRASLRSQDPLGSIPKSFRKEFVDSLAPYEKDQLDRAYRYYVRIANLKDNSKDLFQRKKDRDAGQRFTPKPWALKKNLYGQVKTPYAINRLARQLREKALATRN